MEFRGKYKDINHVLDGIKWQIRDSIPYVNEWCPDFPNPRTLFSFLRTQVVYRKDPHQVELLQSVPTLMDPHLNRHGMAGAGDCDCFTILTLACAAVQRWRGIPAALVLVGRRKSHPVHIYSAFAPAGQWEPFDLTNTFYGVERDYRYRHRLPVDFDAFIE